MSEQINPAIAAIGDSIYRVATKGVIVSRSQLLMVHEPEGWYGLPGGGWKENEPEPTAALRREVMEETGLGSNDFKIEEEPWKIINGGVLDGTPRLNLLYMVDILVDPGLVGIKHGELETRWVGATALSKLELSPTLVSIRKTLVDLLANGR